MPWAHTHGHTRAGTHTRARTDAHFLSGTARGRIPEENGALQRGVKEGWGVRRLQGDVKAEVSVASLHCSGFTLFRTHKT